MNGGDLAFASLAIDPVGGLLLAIPFAILQLHYPAWQALALGIPLAYVQVIAVDAGWEILMKLSWWPRLIERSRSPRVERLLGSRAAFWSTILVTPLVGPWLVMAMMRYARVPQRRVAAPILLGLGWSASAIAIACVLIPRWVVH